MTQQIEINTLPYQVIAPDIIGVHTDTPYFNIGVDEDHDVPALQNINTPLRQSSSAESERMDVDIPDAKDVTMCVIDGIVFRSPHCTYDNCTTELANARGGVFCALHEQEHNMGPHVMFKDV